MRAVKPLAAEDGANLTRSGGFHLVEDAVLVLGREQALGGLAGHFGVGLGHWRGRRDRHGVSMPFMLPALDGTFYLSPVSLQFGTEGFILAQREAPFP